MDIHESRSTPWVSASPSVKRTEQPAELQRPAEIKPQDTHVQNLKPLEQASQAFEAENAPPIVGRGSLALEKFEKVIARITNAVKSFFKDLVAKKPKQEAETLDFRSVGKNVLALFAQLDADSKKVEADLQQSVKVANQPNEEMLSRQDKGKLEKQLGELQEKKNELLGQWRQAHSEVSKAESKLQTFMQELYKKEVPDDLEALGKVISAEHAKVEEVKNNANLAGINAKLSEIDGKMAEIKEKLKT